MTHSLLRRCAWVALFSVLLNALAPTLSYAMAAGQGMAVVEMCTSFGLKKVVVQPGGETDGSTAHGIKHCPFCLSADGSPPAPLVESATLFVPLSTARVAPAVFSPLYDPLLSWSAAHKRGPPLLA